MCYALFMRTYFVPVFKRDPFIDASKYAKCNSRETQSFLPNYLSLYLDAEDEGF